MLYLVEVDLLRRDATDVSHLSSLDVTPTTSGVESIIFANSTCLLSPEGEEGPYCTLHLILHLPSPIKLIDHH